MNTHETAIIMRGVRALCPAQKFDEYSPDMWEPVLADTEFADAKTAIIALGRRQPFISPGEIETEVCRMRNERIRRLPQPCPNHVEGVHSLDELRAINRAMADGHIATAAQVYAYERWGGSLHLAQLRGKVPELEGPEPADTPVKLPDVFRHVPGAEPR